MMSAQTSVIFLVLLALLAPPALAGDDPGTAKAIKGLKKELRKIARSPWVAKKHDEIKTILDSLEALGGTDAGLAALEGARVQDEDIRNRVFALAEENHSDDMLKPLGKLLEDKDLRKDSDLKKRVAHAYQVIGNDKAMEPLSEMIRYDEDDAEVVADAAAALATFPNAKIDKRKIAVKKMIDLYESTYNLMKSVRPEDRIQSKIAGKKYRVYGRPLRESLQALTGRQLAQPREWRRWWNDCKKSKDWRKCKSKLDKD